MTRSEHLLAIIAEECVEIAQRATKALRFGLEQVQEDADDRPEENPEHLTNGQRIMGEYYHLRAVLGMAGFNPWECSDRTMWLESEKCARVERYLERSRRCGTLVDEHRSPDGDGSTELARRASESSPTETPTASADRSRLESAMAEQEAGSSRVAGSEPADAHPISKPDPAVSVAAIRQLLNAAVSSRVIVAHDIHGDRGLGYNPFWVKVSELEALCQHADASVEPKAEVR